MDLIAVPAQHASRPPTPLDRIVSLHDEDIAVIEPRAPVYKFVLTGGPCAGKSTALMEVADRMRSMGYQVFTVPELATIYHASGVPFPFRADRHLQMVWEQSKLQAQIDMEHNLQEYARATDLPTVLLCDRGTMDTKAYMPVEDFELLLERMGTSQVELRDLRYDAVCHMVTAAEGAEEFYTLSNNDARTENLEEACSVDVKTRAVWLGHPRFHIVDNKDTDFKQKVVRVSSFFCDFLHMPAPHVDCRRFLVKILGIDDEDTIVECNLESTFLIAPDEEDEELGDIVLRRRGQDGDNTYQLTLSKRTADGREVVLTTKALTKAHYNAMTSQADNSLESVLRNRLCFEHGNIYFELDTWGGEMLEEKSELDLENSESIWRTLKSDTTYGVLIADSVAKDITFPDFVEPLKDITHEYSLRALAVKWN